METDKGTRHFVGRDARNFRGRVSSAICGFDKHAMRGQTRSGRVYQLIGPGGFAGVAEYVWTIWCSVNAVKEHCDVTDEATICDGDD
ncbi:hypothetical protein V4C53_10330 [Paraburkholderia azotifigens]|uniref:hypothetical protein n=1 Tax=Paraburkholderia azotifigens TaxID=2057004 RepID=UPI00317564E9